MRAVQTLRAGPLRRQPTGPRPPGPDAAADDPFGLEIAREHQWHYSFDRTLQRSSHTVSSVAFSPDGHLLFSGSSSGDVRAWDTRSWTDAGAARGCRGEDFCALEASPSQRWLLAAQPSALRLFGCEAPWPEEHCCAPPRGGVHGVHLEREAGAAAAAEPLWRCAAFAPAAPGRQRGGQAPAQQLAALSTDHLCVMERSGGGGLSQRTHSLPGFAQFTCLAYTACGGCIVCGSDGGHLQVWNAQLLILERTLLCEGARRCLTISPPDAAYEPRLVAGGAESSLHVWRPGEWTLEQVVTDPPSGKAAIHGCSFSPSGAWLITVGKHFCVWRVSPDRRRRLCLCLHQRLEDACGAQGLRAVAVRGPDDFIAVGSQDGLLGLWMRQAGLPPRSPASPSGSSAQAERRRSRLAPGLARSLALRPEELEARRRPAAPPGAAQPRAQRQASSPAPGGPRAGLRPPLRSGSSPAGFPGAERTGEAAAAWGEGGQRSGQQGAQGGRRGPTLLNRALGLELFCSPPNLKLSALKGQQKHASWNSLRCDADCAPMSTQSGGWLDGPPSGWTDGKAWT